MSEWWSSPQSTISCNGAVGITLTGGGSATERNFQLDTDAATISGTVVSNSTYDPITSGNILVLAYSGQTCGDLQRAGGGWVNSCDGTYTIPGLPAGMYHLQAGLSL